MKRKLSKAARRKELTGINLAAIKKELKLVWNHIFDLRANINHLSANKANKKVKK